MHGLHLNDSFSEDYKGHLIHFNIHSFLAGVKVGVGWGNKKEGGGVIPFSVNIVVRKVLTDILISFLKLKFKYAQSNWPFESD